MNWSQSGTAREDTDYRITGQGGTKIQRIHHKPSNFKPHQHLSCNSRSPTLERKKSGTFGITSCILSIYTTEILLRVITMYQFPKNKLFFMTEGM